MINFPEWVTEPTECESASGTYLEMTKFGMIRHRVEMPIAVYFVLYRTRMKNVERFYRGHLLKQSPTLQKNDNFFKGLMPSLDQFKWN